MLAAVWPAAAAAGRSDVITAANMLMMCKKLQSQIFSLL